VPILSELARRKKITYFIHRIPKQHKILEIGCASGWLGNYLRQNGWTNYSGLDLHPPADIVGDIREWQNLGIKPQSFDVIIAFEVLEHVDCLRECCEILKPGGMLMATSPLPSMDGVMKFLEWTGLNQKRTSPHDHLINFHDVSYFAHKEIKTVCFLSQWGIFWKCRR